MMSSGLFLRFQLSLLAVAGLAGCATLLMLPDAVNEDHYRAQAGDLRPQIDAKMKVISSGGRVTATGGKQIGILPVVYIYDATNTLKPNEEAYYVSIFNNGSGSWVRPFAVSASNAIRDELKARGFEPFIYANSDFEKLGMKQVNEVVDKEIFGTQFRAVAYNGDSDETNYAMTDITRFRNAIVSDVEGVMFMKIKADWEPSSANTMNGDIVMNTGVKLGYEIVLCGRDSGCTSLQTPFENGLGTNLFMPNRNTIDREGRDKNYDFLRSLHGDQLALIVKSAFRKMDAQGAFKK
ncbi:MAG: hypothetical protein KF767_01880 [Bdellovibrionaceae bacterium]|nr:hypothetical protein [Pseudobdellovibrionaceae bacterium]